MNGQTYSELKKSYDSNKYYFEFFKHLTTLNTGVIVVMATLLDRLFKQPNFTFLLLVALLGFLISLIGSVFMMYFVVSIIRREETSPFTPSNHKNTALIGTIVSAGFFLIAMICLLAITIKNLLQ